MKTIIKGFIFLTFLSSFSQNEEESSDSIKVFILEEVRVSSIRAKSTDPVTHTNINKEDLKSRNLGQDIPILLNYMPGVVTTSDAGAGIGYTGIRVRGSDASRVNVTLNGIPFNDSEFSFGLSKSNLYIFSTSSNNLSIVVIFISLTLTLPELVLSSDLSFLSKLKVL